MAEELTRLTIPGRRYLPAGACPCLGVQLRLVQIHVPSAQVCESQDGQARVDMPAFADARY